MSSAIPETASQPALPSMSIQELAARLERVERIMGIVRMAQPPMTAIDLGRLRVGAIVEAVAHEMGLTPMAIVSADRAQATFRARAACCWLARRLTTHSLTMIGNVLGRDHSTIVNAIRQAEILRDRDPAFRMVTDRLQRQFTPEIEQKQGLNNEQLGRLRDFLERTALCGKLTLAGDPE